MKKMDNKKVAVAIVILGALVIILSYYFMLINDIKEVGPKDKKETVTPLSDFQVTACNAADRSGTCKTKLPKLNLITQEDCCKYLGKCCESRG
jgi:Tfp pilus assembly protein PilO